MPTLDGLDEIDWSKLTHAYGEASDVPDLIKALVSPRPDEREAAYGELFSNIYHQGTVYDASVHALPFLIDLLATPGTLELDSLAMLVAGIAGGSGYCEVHYAREWTNPFTGKPVSPPVDLAARLARERQIVAQVRERGARAVPLLLPYLRHEDAFVRSEMARTVAWYPEQAPTVVPALEQALSVEPDADVRDIMLAALQALARIQGT
jgi:hypothetical protein